jgi:epoxyqueuosine reductase QueG
MNLRETLTEMALKNNAALAGFGGAERFKETPVEKLLPGTKTVIALAFRVLRGSLRGIEEGSTYYQYTTMGIETIEENIMPRCLLKICGFLEDSGFRALPHRRQWTVMEGREGTYPEADYSEIRRGVFTEPELDFVEAAVLCGLGEQGLSGSLLTKKFGPLQRLCFILTDAEIAENPVAEPSLCNQCRACVGACRGGAISADGSRDEWRCAVYYKGAALAENPFMPPDAYNTHKDRNAIVLGRYSFNAEEAKKILDDTWFYPPVKHGYVSSICGRACDRACYDALEKRGVLGLRYENPFRRREPWSMKPCELPLR